MFFFYSLHYFLVVSFAFDFPSLIHVYTSLQVDFSLLLLSLSFPSFSFTVPPINICALLSLLMFFYLSYSWSSLYNSYFASFLLFLFLFSLISFYSFLFYCLVFPLTSPNFPPLSVYNSPQTILFFFFYSFLFLYFLLPLILPLTLWLRFPLYIVAWGKVKRFYDAVWPLS